MDTLDAVTSVVASYGEHDHFVFPFALFWLVLLIGAIWFFTRGRRCGYPSGDARARDILAERFARGELTGEEYRERLEQLR
jgi:uncharacterized membrane protein